MTLILASASPRRTALLNQMGFAHTQMPVDIDESAKGGETPKAMVERLAAEKALTAYSRLDDALRRDAIILASDTLIAFEGESLGKPADEEDCVAMLQRLSGQVHEVLTSVSVMDAQRQITQTITTEVQFAPVSEAQCRQYWATGEPADKAGSYAIQGIGGQFVKSVKGSVSAVIGLPLYETRCLLNEFGVDA